MGSVYKLAELDISGIKRYVAKYSAGKPTLAGGKQLFRMDGYDVLARSGDCIQGEPLLRPVMIGGHLVEALPSAGEARARAADSVSKLPQRFRDFAETEPWPLKLSDELQRLNEQTRRNVHWTEPARGAR
jgi:nicotinate phosphoribosyltransferase